MVQTILAETRESIGESLILRPKIMINFCAKKSTFISEHLPLSKRFKSPSPFQSTSSFFIPLFPLPGLANSPYLFAFKYKSFIEWSREKSTSSLSDIHAKEEISTGGITTIQKAVKTLSKLDKSLHERAEAVDLSKEGKTSLVLVLLILNDVVEQLAEITKLADPLISPGIDEKESP
jgi:hypothetical protein